MTDYHMCNCHGCTSRRLKKGLPKDAMSPEDIIFYESIGREGGINDS